MDKVFEIASSLDTPLALGGFVAAVLFFIFRKILSMGVFASVGAAGTRHVVTLIIEKLFILALVAMVLGFAAYLVTALVPRPAVGIANKAETISSPTEQPVKREPELRTQIFDRSIGNSGSCTEENVSREFDLCLESGFTVADWSERQISGRNSSFSVVRKNAAPNCVVLTLRYSDYGRGIVGDCKGNGNIHMEIKVNGYRER